MTTIEYIQKKKMRQSVQSCAVLLKTFAPRSSVCILSPIVNVYGAQEPIPPAYVAWPGRYDN